METQEDSKNIQIHNIVPEITNIFCIELSKCKTLTFFTGSLKWNSKRKSCPVIIIKNSDFSLQGNYLLQK